MIGLDAPKDITEANHATLDALAVHLDKLDSWSASLRTYAVTGSRTWFDWRTVWAALSHMPSGSEQFNGMANGADCLCRSFWLSQGSPIRPFEARWKELGKRAGGVRNDLMMESMPRLVLAFLHHQTWSDGTRDAIRRAATRRIPTFVFHQAA
jgi:hypothetical protein